MNALRLTRLKLGYLIGVVGLALIMVVRVKMPGLLPLSPFLLLLSMVMASAVAGGLGPGLLMTLLGAIGTDFLLIPPYHSILTPDASSHVIAFMVEGTIISVLAEKMRRARDQERRAVAARDEVMAVLAHDLRNPLNCVIGYASLLQEDQSCEAPPPVDLDVVGAIGRAGRVMNEMITSLLDSSRIETGKLVLERVQVNVLAACRTAKEILALQAKGKRLDIVASGDEGQYAGFYDQGRLLQLLLNLIGNALKFTPAGGCVTVQLAPQPGQIDVLIKDTGPGIAAGELPHLFERHWQTERTSRIAGSLGLGLYIAKGIAEAHGGRIGVSSQVGVGSEFRVSLPLLSGAGGPHLTTG